MKKSKNLDKAGKDLNKTIKVKIRDFAMIIQNWLEIHIRQNFFFTACPKQENIKLIWVQKVWKHFHNLE